MRDTNVRHGMFIQIMYPNILYDEISNKLDILKHGCQRVKIYDEMGKLIVIMNIRNYIKWWVHTKCLIKCQGGISCYKTLVKT